MEWKELRRLIDEVCIWNRALTSDEIRTQRHLVKDPADDADIVGYYQFDKDITSGFIIDKVRGKDGVLNSNAIIESSDAPVGSGTSQIINVASGGLVSFSDGGDLDIGFGATHPNGKVVVSHLRVLPGILPATPATQGGYWIINNYGANQTFSPLTSMSFKNCGAISNEMSSSFQYDLLTRGSNASQDAWSQVTANSTSPVAGISGILDIAGLSNTTSFSQFIIGRDAPSLAGVDVAITINAIPNPMVSGGESISLLINSNRQGLLLPVHTTTSLNNLGSPEAGQFAFLSDSNALVFFNSTEWMRIHHVPVLQESAISVPPGHATVMIPEGEAAPAYMLGLTDGLVKLPAFTSEDIITLDQPAKGMLIYDSTAGKLRVFNGSEWQALTGTAINLNVSMSAPAEVAGMAVNQDFKHPSSVLELSAAGGKALRLPEVRPVNIYQPVAGVLIFHPETRRLMIYDGSRWNIVQ